jgi:hypothetical protein
MKRSPIKPTSAKRSAEIKGGAKMSGTFKIDVAAIKARQGTMGAKVADTLFGKAKAKPSASMDAKRLAKASADRWFSEFIRLRDAGPDGRVKCVTCSHTDHWRYLQCGHLVTRGHQSTRFDEQNASCQCRGCNYNGGQHVKHAAAIDARYGAGTSEALHIKAMRRCSRTIADYLFLAKSYKAIVDRIKATEPDKYATRKAA